jgi:hypothetical protein
LKSLSPPPPPEKSWLDVEPRPEDPIAVDDADVEVEVDFVPVLLVPDPPPAVAPPDEEEL